MASGKILVSACLCDILCKWNGEYNNCSAPLFKKWREEGRFVPACPEMLGGLPCPRKPCEIRDGRVYTSDGDDVTAEYERGAEETLKIALENDVDFCVLKARSPSCGVGKIHNGLFDGTLVDGDGVTTALLKRHGFRVYTELDLETGVDPEAETAK